MDNFDMFFTCYGVNCFVIFYTANSTMSMVSSSFQSIFRQRAISITDSSITVFSNQKLCSFPK